GRDPRVLRPAHRRGAGRDELRLVMSGARPHRGRAPGHASEVAVASRPLDHRAVHVARRSNDGRAVTPDACDAPAPAETADVENLHLRYEVDRLRRRDMLAAAEH